MTKSNLFCLPFAGGSAYAYYVLQPYIAEHINFVPLELPGHGRRMRDPLCTDLYIMTADILEQIQSYDLNQPYAIFGHSMGALLAYLVTLHLYEKQYPLPKRLIVSGCFPPSEQMPNDNKKSHLPRDEFVDVLRKLDGCPPEVLADPQLIDLFEPVLRADFKAVEEYRYPPAYHRPLPIPFVLLFSDDDPEINPKTIRNWQNESKLPIETREFSGGHFFIFQQLPVLGQILSQC